MSFFINFVGLIYFINHLTMVPHTEQNEKNELILNAILAARESEDPQIGAVNCTSTNILLCSWVTHHKIGWHWKAFTIFLLMKVQILKAEKTVDIEKKFEYSLFLSIWFHFHESNPRNTLYSNWFECCFFLQAYIDKEISN